MSRCKSVVFFWSLLRLVCGIAISDAELVPTKRLLVNDVYHADAVKNLSIWRSSLFDATMKSYKASRFVEAAGHSTFDLFEPFISCPYGETLKRWGEEGDGGKWLCGIDHLKPGCIIFSLGSRNTYGFEEAMLENTPCVVHTFDCTVDGRSLSSRHFFHKLCIGSPEKVLGNPKYITYDDAVQNQSSGIISLLKMDIEGHEFDVFAGWSDLNAELLPSMVSFELHINNRRHGNRMTAMQMSLLFTKLSNLGYAIVSKENNPKSQGCSEFTVLKIEVQVSRL